MLIAIPGNPTAYRRPPAGAQIAAIAALCRIHPCCHCDGDGIRTRVPSRLTRHGSAKIMIDWRWGELWHTADWYEMGWHPCHNGDALSSEGWRVYQRALNPQARFWQPRYVPRRR